MKVIQISRILSPLIIGFSMEGIICCAVYKSTPVVMIISCAFIIALTLVSQLSQQYLLLEKKQRASMIIFGLWVLTGVYFLIMALSILIYLQQFQLNEIPFNSHLIPFMVYSDLLNFQNTCWINLIFYFGVAFSAGFYAREYYRMFWVNSIVFIYRFLKKRVTNLNQTLLSHLPTVPFTQELYGIHCSLCLQDYDIKQPIAQVSCKHIFHRNCIRIWVIKSNCCPLCRKRVIFY